MNWISVDSQLPDMHEPYKGAPYLESGRFLVWVGTYDRGYVTIGRYRQTYKKLIARWEEFSSDRVLREVSHWMPLPDGPNYVKASDWTGEDHES